MSKIGVIFSESNELKNISANKYLLFSSTNNPNTIGVETLSKRIEEIETTIPTKVSELENDSQFITDDDIPTKLSELETDSNNQRVSSAEKSSYAGKSEKPVSIAYTTSIPFDNICSTLAGKTLTSNDTFTKNTTNELTGNCATVILIGNGTNSPVFTNFTKFPTSKDYVATLNTVNVIVFWKQESYYFYNIAN